MSKHAVGVYSCTPGSGDWLSSEKAFEEAGNSVSLASEFSGSAVVETFTVKMIPKGPWLAVLATNDEGERVIAASLLEPGELHDKFTRGEPIGERVAIEPSGENTHRVVGLV
jgi:hypothetical protein